MDVVGTFAARASNPGRIDKNRREESWNASNCGVAPLEGLVMRVVRGGRCWRPAAAASRAATAAPARRHGNTGQARARATENGHRDRHGQPATRPPSRALSWSQTDPATQYTLADGTLVTQIGGRVRDRHAREQPDTPGTGDPVRPVRRALLRAPLAPDHDLRQRLADQRGQPHPDGGRAPAVVAVRHQLPLRLHRPPRRRPAGPDGRRAVRRQRRHEAPAGRRAAVRPGAEDALSPTTTRCRPTRATTTTPTSPCRPRTASSCWSSRSPCRRR